MFTMFTSVDSMPSFSSHFRTVICCAVPTGVRMVMPFTVSGLPFTVGEEGLKPSSVAMGLSGFTNTPRPSTLSRTSPMIISS